MITACYILLMLGLLIWPLFKAGAKSQDQPVVYKNDTDTTNAHYAVNQNGFLEEIPDSKVVG